jgi:hypothetical protein
MGVGAGGLNRRSIDPVGLVTLLGETSPLAGERARSEAGVPTLEPKWVEGAGETAGEGRTKLSSEGIGGASRAFAAAAT